MISLRRKRIWFSPTKQTPILSTCINREIHKRQFLNRQMLYKNHRIWVHKNMAEHPLLKGRIWVQKMFWKGCKSPKYSQRGWLHVYTLTFRRKISLVIWTLVYNWRDGCTFHINIFPWAIFRIYWYGVFISKMTRYVRTCSYMTVWRKLLILVFNYTTLTLCYAWNHRRSSLSLQI